MARPGLSFDEVKHAADAQLKAGVRPTIQSLHAALGTGSSTTILKHLNDWWQQLGQRLVSQQAALAIPDAPANVLAAAGTFWHTALEAANALLGERRQELETHYQGQVDALESAKTSALEAVAIADARAQSADQRANNLTAQLADADSRVQELRRHLDDLRSALQNATDQLQQRDRQVISLQTALNSAQESTALESARSKSHIEATENRCAREIDIARCAARELASELKESKQQQDAQRAKASADLAHWKAEAASHSAHAQRLSAELHAAQTIHQAQAQQILQLDERLREVTSRLLSPLAERRPRKKKLNEADRQSEIPGHS